MNTKKINLLGNGNTFRSRTYTQVRSGSDSFEILHHPTTGFALETIISAISLPTASPTEGVIR